MLILTLLLFLFLFFFLAYCPENVVFFGLLDADMEDYGFEYSDEEPEEQDVDIENQYYNSKGDHPMASLCPSFVFLFSPHQRV